MSLKKKIQDTNETLVELVAGIALVTVVAGIVGAILIGTVEAFRHVSILVYLYSLLLGAICAAFLVTHLYRTLDRGLDMVDAGDAAKYSRRGYLLRLLFVVIILLCSLKFSFLNFVGVIIGLFALKVSIYMRALTRKLLNKVLA